MPLYEYRCDRCGTVFEVLQSFSDEPLTVHDNCGGALERLLSPPALQFRGTGWYVTDYARSGDGKQAGKAMEEPKAPPARTETSSADTCSSPGANK